MGYLLLKFAVSAALIVAISEISKRSTFVGGLLASLPLVSILAFVWLYHDTRSLDKVAALSTSIFWLVLPSLSLFLVLPYALRRTESFPMGIGISIAVMLALYGAMLMVLRYFKVEL